MKLIIPNCFTPLHVKLTDTDPWPEDKVFYLLTSDGCFLCRNHLFFKSSVRTNALPTELAAHKPFLELRYPKIAQATLEQIVGFFSVIADRHNAEAAGLLVFNRETGAVETIVPPQTSINTAGWLGDDRGAPCSVHYEVPPLASHLTLIGDIHSHVEMAAFASFTDETDETHRPGLHLIVGKIDLEPPEFHVEAVVDGTRFTVPHLDDVVAGYKQRVPPKSVPKEWLAQVTVKRQKWKPCYGGWPPDQTPGQTPGQQTFPSNDEADRLDRWFNERRWE